MIIHGDCLDELRKMESASVDAIVTDPPYGLSFMGKKWDYDVPSVDVWKECLRVLKPGGHALIACGTRTQHRMAVNIEDAGFEIRDVITWLYGSGFPKSLDVSKAIDKAAGAEREVVGKYTSPEGTTGTSQGGLFNGGGLTDITAPATEAAKQWAGWGTALKPATEHWTLARKPLCNEGELWYETHKLCLSLLNAFPAEKLSQLNPSEYVAGLNTVQWNAANAINTLAALYGQMATLPSESVQTSSLSIVSLWQSILGALLKNANTFTTETVSSLTIDLRILNCLLSKNTQESTLQTQTQENGSLFDAPTVESVLRSVAIKLSCIQSIGAECAAQQDTDSLTDKLKPNSEFWTLARKPLEGTVAANVSKWGVGGINVDGCRIETTDNLNGGAYSPGERIRNESAFGGGVGGGVMSGANGEFKQPTGRFPSNLILDEEAARLLDEQSGTLTSGSRKAGVRKGMGFHGAYGDGGPEIFGNTGGASRFFYVAKASKSERNAGCETNGHPTVKPLKLMRYLCRLITPPGGLVLDPFAGSGSTLVAAKQEGFSFIGIEREIEYVAIINARVGNEKKQENLCI